VQLVGGDFDHERVRISDPIKVARDWVRAGFRLLHVVDLDAATARGSNRGLLRELVRVAGVPVQVGGGICTLDQVEEWLDVGASRVVIGTRALQEPDWLAAIASQHPGAIVLAADVRGRQVVVSGWSRVLARDIADVLSVLQGLPLAALLVTAVHREGRMEGPDLALVRDVCAASPVPVLASGGIGDVLDLRNLEHCGAAGAVIGMALYTGALDSGTTAQEFSQ
jgi:phosphoribosylformimino-5-aminoimidazole carboxamide ribotide isomerase